MRTQRWVYFIVAWLAFIGVSGTAPAHPARNQARSASSGTRAARANGTAIWEGTLIDANCYLENHAYTGDNHMGDQDCGEECLKMGFPAGILTDQKVFHALIASSLSLAPYLGNEVRITGSLHNGAIWVKQAEARRNDRWEAIKLQSKM
jgi:hypothetical protein